jgi:mannose-6-phosphate isomerase-like protein (cupin superfamily)
MAATVATNADAVWQDGYLAPTCEATGVVRSSLFRPEGYSLWQVEGELAEGAELRWAASGHGDEAVYLLDGELDVDGVRCGPETTAIVEAGVAVTMRAVTASRVIHAGPSSTEPPRDGLLGAAKDDGHSVHVVPLEDARPLYLDRPRGPRYYADSTCETCRIAFFKVASDEASVAASHIHSEDEIIRVLTGELQVGRTTVPAGMSVAIPGNYRYGFRTPGAYSFLNYRRDASTYVAAPGSEPIIETIDSFRALHASQSA